MDSFGTFADFSIVDNSARLLDALNRLDGQKLRKVLSKRDDRGYTILHVATERNQTESLKCLVIKKVDVNVKATPASNEVTPLHVAVMCGHLACLQLLVQSGGDVMALDSNNLTASDYAIREGQMFCLGYLEEQIAKKEEDEKTIISALLTDIEKCLARGDLSGIASLEHFNEFFHSAKEEIMTPDIISSRRCSLVNSQEVVKVFSTISRDVPVLLHGATILHLACYHGNIELVKQLLLHFPPLLYAQTREGYDPLHTAVLHRRHNIVQLLILTHMQSQLSRLQGPSREGGVAQEEGSYQDSLGGGTASGHTSLHFAVANGDVAMVTELVRHLNDLKLAMDSSGCGYTALHIAVLLQHTSIVSLLLHKGAGPNTHIDKSMVDRLRIGATPLAEAVLGGSKGVVDILLEHGAEDRQHEALKVCFKSPNHSGMIPPIMGSLLRLDDIGLKERRKGSRVKPGLVDWSGLQLVTFDPLWLNAGVARSMFFRNQNISKNVLEYVTTLNISSNQLTTLPWEVFGCLPKLVVLNASSNCLRSLPDPASTTEGACECITRLDFSKNQLISIPDYIFQLPNMSVLDVSDNKISSLSPLLWTSPKLHNFNCSKNRLEAIPVPVVPVRVLVTSSPVPVVSPSPMKATTLKRTSIDSGEAPRYPYCTDRDFPFNNRDSPIAEATPISKLEDRLNICNGNLPIDWGQSQDKEEVYEGLSSLNLSHNQIKEVPDCLPCLCPKLVRLDLSYNQIESVALPKSFPASLKQLTVSNNPITELDSEKPAPKPLGCCNPLVCRDPTGGEEGPFCQHRRHHHLLHLTILDFSHCSLELVNLYSHHKGRTVDDQSLLAAIANTQAQKSYRNLEAFARLVCPLLTRLVLSNNMLDKVPPSVCDMTTLNSLDLSYNNIIDLPAALGKLSNLWEFPLAGLKLISPPHNIIERGKTKDIIGFLWSLLQRARPYHRMKLMFTGKAAMGKTSLLEKISERGQRGVQENWALNRIMAREGVNKEKLSTVGIVVSDWTYYKKVHESQTALKSITFMTWDFGGQEEYYATHQCFISRRALYIVVWNMVKGMSGVQDLKPWLLNIQARAPHSPVIIVGSHLDQIKTRAQRAEMQQCRAYIQEMYGFPDHSKEGYPQIMGIEEVSSKTGKNIDRLRGLIFDVASMVKENTVAGRGLGCGRIPEYRLLMDQLVPASYLQLEDTVRNIALAMRARKKPPVMTYKELRDWVFADPSTLISKSSEDRELEQAVRFLHDNGTMLHYEDPVLSNLYFVDPQWLVDMLAHIVTVREINPLVKEGIMRTADFALIFQEEEFPISWKKEYIRLLTTFEVAVELGENELLIPSVLPEMRPILPQGTLPPDLKLLPSLHHTHVVPFVPSGLWPRLMSRILTDPKIKQLAIDGCGLTPDEDTPLLTWVKWRQGIIYRYGQLNLLEVEELQGKMFGNSEGCSVELYKDEKWRVSEATVFGIDVKVHDIYPVLKYGEVKVQPGMGGASSGAVGGASSGAVGGASSGAVGGASSGAVGGTSSGEVGGASSGAVGGALSGAVGRASSGAVGGASSGAVGGASSGAVDGASALVGGPATPDVSNEEVKIDDLDSEFAKVTRKRVSGLMATLGDTVQPATIRPSSSPAQPTTTDTSPSSPAQPATKNPPSLSEDRFDQMRAGLLSKVVEHISLLIDDWFVGVRPRSVVVPCPHCTAARAWGPVPLERSFSDHAPPPCPMTSSVPGPTSSQVTRYVFDYEDCVVAARSRDYVECPAHGRLPLAYVAPDTLFLTQGRDIILGDKDILKEDVHVLGKGAFATVFRAKVKSQQDGSRQYKDVALKALTKEWQHQMDQSSNDIHETEAVQDMDINSPHQPTRHSIIEGFSNLKKELSILCQLKHGHIVEFYGVLLRPLGLVLELATKGSLKHMLKVYCEKSKHLASNVSQAVIKQISSALAYLHDMDIIYRDCKSDNVLVWQFPDPDDHTPRGVQLGTNLVLVKLSDYGISQFAATQGARGLVGTPGFMAPEILKYHGREVYGHQVDVFSFAMLIYEMVTLHTPYETLTAQQANQSNENGARPSLSRKDLPCPVLLRELMAWCWQQAPDDRPTAKKIVETVDTHQFLRLLDGIRVCDNTQVISCCYRIVSAYSRNAVGQHVSGGGRRNSPTAMSSPLTRGRESFEVHSTKLPTLSEEGVELVKSKEAGQEGVGGATRQEGLGGVTVQEGVGGASGQEGYQGLNRSTVQAAFTADTTNGLQGPVVASSNEVIADDDVRPKHSCPDDVIGGPSPNENYSPNSQYGDDDIICELWVASTDGHHSVATVIDFTGRFVNTEDIDLGDTPVKCICMVGDRVWIGFGIGCMLIYDAMSRRISAQVWIKHLTAINHIVHIPSLKRVFVALDNGSVLSYSDNPTQLMAKSPLINLTLTPEAHYHDNTQVAAALLAVPVLTSSVVTHELWVGQRSMITILNPSDLSVVQFITTAIDPSQPPSYMSYLVYAHLVCSMTFEQATSTLAAYTTDPELKRACVNVYGSSYHGHHVMRWNCYNRALVQSLDCRQHVEDKDCYISALHYSNLQLFIGMTTGSILILDARDFSSLCLLHCHCSQTKALLVLNLAQQEHDMSRDRGEVLVSRPSSPSPIHKAVSYTSQQSGGSMRQLLSLGTGFKSYFDCKAEQRPFANSAYLLVWDSEHWDSST